MAFALFPSPFIPENKLGLWIETKKKKEMRNSELSFVSIWNISRFFFLNLLSGSVQVTGGGGGGDAGPQKIEPEDSGLSDHSHFSFLPISHTTNLENSG